MDGDITKPLNIITMESVVGNGHVIWLKENLEKVLIVVDIKVVDFLGIDLKMKDGQTNDTYTEESGEIGMRTEAKVQAACLIGSMLY